MALPITKITTHQVDAKARLPGEMISSTNFRAFLDVLVKPYQDIEDLLISLLDGHSVETAVGVQLDVVGSILDLKRLSATETDTAYRTRLLGRAAEFSASGEAETLISVWFAIWSPVVTIWYDEFKPAAFEVTAELVADPGSADQDQAAVIAIGKAKAGGVAAVTAVVEEHPFIWGDAALADASGDLANDANHGWGDSANADGSGDITPGVGQGGNFTRIIT